MRGQAINPEETFKGYQPLAPMQGSMKGSVMSGLEQAYGFKVMNAPDIGSLVSSGPTVKPDGPGGMG